MPPLPLPLYAPPLTPRAPRAAIITPIAATPWLISLMLPLRCLRDFAFDFLLFSNIAYIDASARSHARHAIDVFAFR
jgi:hypothetical protein